MSSRNERRSDQEWIELICECRKSSMSNKDWCGQHGIPVKSFYNNIARLKKKGLEIPGTVAPKQEVVELGFPVPTAGGAAAAVLEIRGCRIEVMEHATEDTLRNIFSALEALC